MRHPTPLRTPWPLLNRRQFALAAAVSLPLAAPRRAGAAGTEVLRVLAWPGYADADIVKTFEQRMACRVEVTVIDSDVDLWQKISQHTPDAQPAAFDVFAVNTAELQRYIQQNWVQPIATATVPNLTRQLPRFQNRAAIPGLVHAGKTYAIPYTYAEMGLVYDRQQIKQPPTSIAALWDPRYQGKVIAYNAGTHNFALAAMALGLKSPFRLTDSQWPQAVERLIALRRNAGGFYTQPEESLALFKNRHAALLFANYGRQQEVMFRAAGLDVGYAIPKEGALAWLDCWAITRGATNPTLAAAWISYLLEPEPGLVLVKRQGLANTTSASSEYRAEDRLVWLEPVESEERRNLLWTRIVSGDRASKVLSP
ncbi:extracellular solute-binding protein [Rhodoferax sp.]|uniref:ABC transporter substrate-binding protein n=1 Tax=Rhodoferax sp. TaxID=50421 RepID=UPI0025CE09F1|nr:extracellular solute-binding protein [Rhodoferax sp.]